MNKKGQVLVAFLLLLPLLLLFITFLIDKGVLAYQKRNIESNISTTLYNALDHLDYSKTDLETYITTLLNKNLENMQITIQIENDIINITVETTLTGVFSSILHNDTNVTINYIAYIENNQKIIKKK